LGDVGFLGAQILAHEHRNGNAASDHGHERQGVDVERNIGGRQTGGPQTAHNENKSRKAGYFKEELHTRWESKPQQPDEKPLFQPPAFPGMIDTIVATGQQQNEKYQQGKHTGNHRGNGGASNAELRKSPVSENQGVVQNEVNHRGRSIDPHHRPCFAPTAEKSGQRIRADIGAAAQAHDLKIDNFVLLNRWAVADQLERRAGEGDDTQHDEPTDQRHIDALPEGRTDAMVPPRPVILGHERTDIAGSSHEDADDGKTEHSRGHSCCNGFRRVPRQKHPVHKVLDRPGGGA